MYYYYTCTTATPALQSHVLPRHLYYRHVIHTVITTAGILLAM